MRNKYLAGLAAAVVATGLPLAVGVVSSSATESAPALITKPAVASPERALQYWTPARMAAAKPLPLLTGTSPDASSGPAPAPAPISEIAPLVLDGGTGANPEGSFAAVPRPYTKFPAKTNGVIFLKVPGDPADYYCTGSAASSANKSVVWTASPCLYSPGAGWNENIAFVPGYGSSPTNLNPYGAWTEFASVVPIEWTTSPGIQSSFGALIVGKRNGKTLGQTLGGMDGLRFNSQPGAKIHSVFSYADAPFDVNLMYRCNDRVTRDTRYPAANRPLLINCGPTITGSMSGSNWKTDIGATGRGFIVGISVYKGPNGRIGSPYLGVLASQLAAAAGAIAVS